MKKTNRIKLYCYKTLPCGMVESFTVIVIEQNIDATRKKYESEGYTVR